MEPSRSRFSVKKSLYATSRGFTLIEMLVVLAIIVIITSIALVGQATFNRSVLLTDTAYSIALSLRQMQSLGLSSRKYAGVQDAGYGAHFGTPPLTTYTLFADTMDADTSSIPANCEVGSTLPAGHPEKKPGDCIYTAGADQVVQTLRFGRGYTINRFCGRENTTGSPLRCSNDATLPLQALSIVFTRSTTDTAFVARRNGAWTTRLLDAHVYLRSGDSTDERVVCFTGVGQISVATSTCP